MGWCFAPLLPLLGIAPAQAEDTEGRWVWGDLHAHSGWSFDGCEHAEAGCTPRGDLPAEDFFANAAAQNLDFAALTDHAEADLWMPEGEGGAEIEIWDGMAATVAAAADGPVLGVLGYEWTNTRDDEEDGQPRGSHRTVLFDDPSACAARHIGGQQWSEARETLDGGGAFVQAESAESTRELSDLWDTLDAAQDACGPFRWLSFAHHSAYRTPQPTVWSLAENAPDRETLVEIYSEHGSSECLNTSASGCDWRLNSAQSYLSEGSVQAALDEGFVLGFLAGTDSHDARPGSTDDGPSAVAHAVEGGARVQFDAGGLSGVFLEDGGSGAPAVGDLFDALEARRTLASSGPRPALLATARGEDGKNYLPGEVIPLDARPLRLRLDPGEAPEGYTLVSVEQIGPGGERLGQGEGSWSNSWDPRPGDWTYLRLRYLDAEGVEERVWLSPWFAARRCGCASAGQSGGALLAALGVLARRRRRSIGSSERKRLML